MNLKNMKGKWQGWRDSNPQPSVLETAVLPIRTTPLWCLTHKFYLHYPWEFSVISMESAVSQGREAYYTQDNKRHKVFVNHVGGNSLSASCSATYCAVKLVISVKNYSTPIKPPV